MVIKKATLSRFFFASSFYKNSLNLADTKLSVIYPTAITDWSTHQSDGGA
jgi:hypothetical protein